MAKFETMVGNILLTWLTYLGLVAGATTDPDKIPEAILSTPEITLDGEWGSKFEYCKEDEFVTGMQLKSGPKFGLTGLHLICSPLGETSNLTTVGITSMVGEGGRWGNRLNCKNNGVVIGIQMRSHHASPRVTAAQNFRIFCTAGANRVEEITGYGTSKYDTDATSMWTAKQICPSRTAVCGLKTQVDTDTGLRGSPTGLNNVEVVCCPVFGDKFPCNASDGWELIRDCDNKKGLGPQVCEFTVRTGYSESKSSSQIDSGIVGIAASVGFTAGSSFLGGLVKASVSVDVGVSSTTGTSWEAASDSTFSELTETSAAFEVAANSGTRLWQVVGVCGGLQVAPNSYRRQDY